MPRRFDSPSVFGRLLDDGAGHWSLRPSGASEAVRRYLDRTMVLETTWRSATTSGPTAGRYGLSDWLFDQATARAEPLDPADH